MLSQLGVFREYVESLEPPVVVWFVNSNFAESRDEASQPVLLGISNDPTFSQRLRERQQRSTRSCATWSFPLTSRATPRSDESEARRVYVPAGARPRAP